MKEVVRSPADRNRVYWMDHSRNIEASSTTSYLARGGTPQAGHSESECLGNYGPRGARSLPLRAKLYVYHTCEQPRENLVGIAFPGGYRRAKSGVRGNGR